MHLYYYSLLTVFSIILAVMIVDPNVADYFNLYLKFLSVKIKSAWLMIKIHPKNPITNFLMKRKYSKIAKQLEQELKNKKS